MPRRKIPLTTTLFAPVWWQNALKTWEIAIAAPQVIAHRTARMAAAGSRPSVRDRREFTRMSQEKIDAFGESLIAMAAPMWKINQDLAALAVRQWWRTWAGPSLMAGVSPTRVAEAYVSLLRNFATGASSKQLQASFGRLVKKGLTPVHRRATANAKRLSGPKR